MSADKESDEASIAVDLSTGIEQFAIPVPGSQSDSIPFGDISVCKTAANTAANTAVLVAAIISDKLGRNDEQKQKLAKALTTYFSKVGIDSEETFAFIGMADSLSTDVLKGEVSCDDLTLPVILCLKETAALTEKASQSGNYLTRMVAF